MYSTVFQILAKHPYGMQMKNSILCLEGNFIITKVFIYYNIYTELD